MCCRVCILTNQEEIENYFKQKINGTISLPNYNIPPTNTLPILFNKTSINTALWGIRTKNHFIFNSRIETLLSKKNLVFNKCIIITSGFYEWGKNNQAKIPYFVKNKNEPFTLLAGLFYYTKDHYYFSVITHQSPNEFLKIHNRIPLIIKFQDIHLWLNNNNLNITYKYLQSNNKLYTELELKKVSSKVNNPRYNKPDIFIDDFYQDSLF